MHRLEPGFRRASVSQLTFRIRRPFARARRGRLSWCHGRIEHHAGVGDLERRDRREFGNRWPNAGREQFDESNGVVPVSVSYRSTPSEKMSVRVSTSSDDISACSGLL